MRPFQLQSSVCGWTPYQRSCWCWWSFWSGLSSCRTPSPPLKKVNQTKASLCPLVGRDGGPDEGCGCGGFLSPVTSSPVQSNICHSCRRDSTPAWQNCLQKFINNSFKPIISSHLSQMKPLLLKKTDSTCRNLSPVSSSNEKTHFIFLERSHCAWGCLFSWWMRMRRIRWVIILCAVDVAAFWRGAYTPNKQGPSVWTLLHH